jgi:multiple sugar transport system permease protein
MRIIRWTPKRSKTLWGYLFLAPALLFFIIIVIYPMIRSFQFSFYDWPLGVDKKTFVGLENYRKLLFEDEVFTKSMLNTFIFTFCTVVPTITLSIGLALLLDKNFKGRGIFRTIYFIPVVSSLVAVGFVWSRLFEPTFGLVNNLLRFFGIDGPGWLSSPKWALPAIMIVSVWRDLGYYAVLFLAGLQTIPSVFYEAATVDGANKWQKFWNITFPLLNPTIVFCAVIGVINGLQLYTQVFIMTGGTTTTRAPGGPSNATRSIVMHIVQSAFRSLDMGYASAAAFILFILIIIFTLIQFKLIERQFEY